MDRRFTYQICIFGILAMLVAELSSCTGTRRIPLKGQYQNTPVKSKFDRPFEEIWEAVIDFVGDTGQDVQLIDKASGLIISEAKVASGPLLSNEDSKGTLINKDAYIAVEHYSSMFAKGSLLHTASANWVIRVKPIDKESTYVGVILHVKNITEGPINYHGESTGNFEKDIMDQISRKLNR